MGIHQYAAAEKHRVTESYVSSVGEVYRKFKRHKENLKLFDREMQEETKKFHYELTH